MIAEHEQLLVDRLLNDIFVTHTQTLNSPGICKDKYYVSSEFVMLRFLFAIICIKHRPYTRRELPQDKDPVRSYSTSFIIARSGSR